MNDECHLRAAHMLTYSKLANAAPHPIKLSWTHFNVDAAALQAKMMARVMYLDLNHLNK